MTVEEMADLMARAYGQLGRAWSVKELSDLLAASEIIAKTTDHAFLLGRMVVDEAEILMIVTDPNHQRTGRAKQLLTTFEEEAGCNGVGRVFLEVAEDNHAARHLYQSCGYTQIGQRRGYYPRTDSPACDALVLEKTLDFIT